MKAAHPKPNNNRTKNNGTQRRRQSDIQDPVSNQQTEMFNKDRL